MVLEDVKLRYLIICLPLLLGACAIADVCELVAMFNPSDVEKMGDSIQPKKP